MTDLSHIGPAPWSAERLLPAWQETPLDFLSIDALAAGLVRQRPDRELLLVPALMTDGERDWRAQSVFAIRPRDRAAFHAGRVAFARDYLGVASGPRSSDLDQLTAAVRRVRTAGGMAA